MSLLKIFPILSTIPKTPLLKNEYRYLNNTILKGHLTCESQPFKSF